MNGEWTAILAIVVALVVGGFALLPQWNSDTFPAWGKKLAIAGFCFLLIAIIILAVRMAFSQGNQYGIDRPAVTTLPPTMADPSGYPSNSSTPTGDFSEQFEYTTTSFISGNMYGGYSMNYPSNWQVSEIDNANILVFPPEYFSKSSSANLVINGSKKSSWGTAKQAAERSLEASQKSSGFTESSDIVKESFGGKSTYMFSDVMVSPNLMCKHYFFELGAYTFHFATYSPIGEYDKYKQLFMNVVSTFTLTK